MSGKTPSSPHAGGSAGQAVGRALLLLGADLLCASADVSLLFPAVLQAAVNGHKFVC